MLLGSTCHLFGLLAFLMLAVGLAYIPLRWPHSRHETFSRHVADTRNSIIYYIILFAAALFIICWFVPTFHLSVWFIWLTIASSVAQILCTIFPETGGWRTRVHRLSAGVSGLLLLPATLLLLTSPILHAIDKAIIVLGAVTVMAVIGIIAASKGRPHNYLILQIMYYLGFFIPLLWVAYASCHISACS